MLVISRRWQSLVVLVNIRVFLGLSLPASANSGGFHLVTGVRGNVQVQRKGQNNQGLKTADKLLLGQGGKATLLCQNLHVKTLRQTGTFEVAKVCQVDGRNILQSLNSNRLDTRGFNDSTLPYIISPRNTVLIEAKPLLRWNSVVGSKSYRVLVTGPDLKWETTVNQSQVVYGGDPLKSGVRYRVTVTAEKGESSERDGVTGFSRSDDLAVTQISADIQELQQQDLSEEAKVLAVAHLEHSNELYSSAIERLEGWLKKGNQSAAGSQLLGDLYRQVGLPTLAREQYVAALPLIRRDEDLLGEAGILSSLGQIDRNQGHVKESIMWLEKAQTLYQKIEDDEQIRILNEQLAYLRKKI
jgi:hypothetical protein